MKNRLLFLMVAGAFALPVVAAPQAEWSLYGTLATEVYSTKTTGATAGASADYASRTKMSSATSNIGFKGGMQVADDFKAIWQVESQLFTDGGADATKGQGTWANRNSAVGLTGSWGTVMLGQWDTPYKAIQVPITQVRAGVVSDMSILGQAGFGTLSATTADGVTTDETRNASFKRCQGNSIQYWSPVVQGFQAKVMYSTNESKGVHAATGAKDNPTLISGSVTYSNKALNLNVFYGFEQHNDYYGLDLMSVGTGTSSKDTGHELAVYWIAPTKTRVTAIVEQLKFKMDGTLVGNFAEYKRTAWFVSAGHPITEHHKVWGSYGSAGAGDMKLTGGASYNAEYGAKQYALGYTYSFNKNAEVYAFCTGIKNEKNAQYNIMPPTPAPVAAGADVRAIGVGLFYTF